MKTKTPPVGEVSRGLPASFTPANFTLTNYRAQHLASRYALPIETAAIVAALAFGGVHHG